MSRTQWMAAAAIWIAFSGLAMGQQSPAPTTQPDRQALEKELADRLTDARLTGFYTADGQQGSPRPDAYILKKVEKTEGDKWLFTAVIAYGKQSMAIPLEIPVFWAGDTPVISVTDFKVPGMGSYTARVMIYKDHYAGTWSGTAHGGYLWGRIEHVDKTAATQSSESGKQPN